VVRWNPGTPRYRGNCRREPELWEHQRFAKFATNQFGAKVPFLTNPSPRNGQARFGGLPLFRRPLKRAKKQWPLRIER